VGILHSVYKSIVHGFHFNMKLYMFIVFIFLIHVAMYIEMLNISLNNILISYLVELLKNSKCTLR
jgi:hypothetical protein